jgi:hypothetical protein
MAEFQGTTRRAGVAIAHGRVIGRLFRPTKLRSLFLALRNSDLRRSDELIDDTP